MSIKKNYCTFTLVCFFLTCAVLHAQNGSPSFDAILPPSPTAASLVQFGEANANHQSGGLTQSIPLYTFSTKSISIPIVLNYNSGNGVLVDQISSWVGMSWNLNSGGLISRVVLDDPDEESETNLPDISSSNITDDDIIEFISTADDPSIDLLPDIYSFDFLSYSGKFLLRNSEVILLSRSNLKIYPVFDLSNLSGFKIVTDNGLVFLFGGENATESSRSTVIGAGCGRTYDRFRNTSWWLTSIEDQYGSKIVFDYEGTSFNYSTSVSQTRTKIQNPPPSCSVEWPNFPDKTCKNILHLNSKHLKRIKSLGFGEVVFYSSLRSTNDGADINDVKLDSIVVLNEEGRKLSHFVFSYIYAKSNQSIPAFLSDESGLDKRMFLYEVRESGKNPYRFEYNDINGLPPRLSFSQDHYGFYNGKQNSSLIPNGEGNIFDNLFGNSGANRDCDSMYSRKGLLEKIVHPTGGMTFCKYESNNIVINSSTLYAGGNRISEVHYSSASNTSPKIIKYFYNNYEQRFIPKGRLNIQPKYTNNFILEQRCAPQYGPYGDPGWTTATYYTLGSGMLNRIILPNSSTVLYDFITESYGQNFEYGGKEYNYSAIPDGQGEILWGQTPIWGAPRCNDSYRNGLLLSETTFKVENDRKIVLETKSFNYEEDFNFHKSNAGYVIQQFYNPSIVPSGISMLNNFTVMKIYYYSSWLPLRKMVQTSYDQNGENPLVNTTEYHYSSPLHVYPTSIKQSTNETDFIETKYKFPLDYNVKESTTDPVSRAIYDLQSKNNVLNYVEKIDVNACGIIQSGFLIKNIVDSKGRVAFSSLNKLSLDRNISIDDFEMSNINSSGNFILSQDYEKFECVDSYDNYGNILTYEGKDHIYNSIIWGYSGIYPIAKAINTTVDRVAYSGFEGSSPVPTYGGEWVCGHGELHKGEARTGSYSLENKGSTIATQKTLPAGKYRVSLWAKNKVGYTGGAITINGHSGEPMWPGGAEWRYNERIITLSSAQQVVLSTTDNLLVDDICLAPVDAQVETYTYDSGVGMTSQTDPNGLTTYYEYDGLGRLRVVRDHEGSILKRYDYHYREGE